MVSFNARCLVSSDQTIKHAEHTLVGPEFYFRSEIMAFMDSLAGSISYSFCHDVDTSAREVSNCVSVATVAIYGASFSNVLDVVCRGSLISLRGKVIHAGTSSIVVSITCCLNESASYNDSRDSYKNDRPQATSDLTFSPSHSTTPVAAAYFVMVKIVSSSHKTDSTPVPLLELQHVEEKMDLECFELIKCKHKTEVALFLSVPLDHQPSPYIEQHAFSKQYMNRNGKIFGGAIMQKMERTVHNGFHQWLIASIPNQNSHCTMDELQKNLSTFSVPYIEFKTPIQDSENMTLSVEYISSIAHPPHYYHGITCSILNSYEDAIPCVTGIWLIKSSIPLNIQHKKTHPLSSTVGALFSFHHYELKHDSQLPNPLM